MSANSEMCSWKRGKCGLLRATSVLSSMGTCSDDEKFGGW